MQTSDHESQRSRAAVVAVVAVLCAVAWLGIDVAFNFGGHISGLFWTGSGASLPPDLDKDHTRRVSDPVGYDGMYYHLAAHDPLIRRGFIKYFDNPRLRWRRIGVPGLAALVTAGSDRYVDYAYVAIQLVFVFVGCFWLGRYAQRQGVSAAWGLAFLLIPAVAVSLDRMTIDLPLAALAIGLILYGSAAGENGAHARWPVYAILCAAPLVRETGMVLVLAWCVYSLVRRSWLATVLGAACGLPAIAWWAYVQRRTPVDATPWLASYPFSGLVNRTLEGITDPTSTWWLRAAVAFEELALAGIWLALLLACYLALKRRRGLIEVTAILFAACVAALGMTDIWATAYATGRTMSPLLIMLGLLALKERRRVFALPLLLVLPRIALQYEAQIKSAIRGML
jgi:hypothetical protein